MDKTVQDLKMELEAIKKTKSEAILGMENLGMRIGTIDTASITEYKRWNRESQG